MTRAEFAIPFALLLEVRDFTATKPAQALWHRTVNHLPAQVWAAAVDEYLQHDTGLAKPTPAAVLRYAGTYGLTPEERADLIWSKVVEAMRRHTVVQFDDPAVNLAIRNCGGMVSLRSGPSGELHFRKSAFIRAYAACVRAKAGDSRPLDCLPEESGTAAVLMRTGLPEAHPALALAEAVTPTPAPRLTVLRSHVALNGMFPNHEEKAS